MAGALNSSPSLWPPWKPWPCLICLFFPGDPNSQWGKEFTIEKAVISSEFDVFAKKNQGILEFYGDDIALLKLAQKVKMSTHARC